VSFRRSMTDNGDTTMASAETADPPFKTVTNPSKSKRLKVTPAQKIAVERTHSFAIRAYFPQPGANTKFNPVTNMRALMIELIKCEPSIAVADPINKNTIVLSSDPFPTNESEFKKFFAISTDTRATANKQHIIIGCQLLSERTMKEIKFDKSKPQFLEWLDKNKIFIESDSLGVNKTTTVGYIMKLHPQLTNRTTLKALIQQAFDDIQISPELAVELDPSLKATAEQAKSNGDFFNPEVPNFEIYKTKLVHGRDKKNKVETDVLGIKSAAPQVRLLKEFFAQLGSPAHYEKQLGVFVPTGAVHLLGAANYVNMICDNNQFIHNVVTIPIGDFQHETLDIPFSIDTSTDIDQTTLLELIADQTWCLSVEKTMIANKVILTTTKSNLEQARLWVDKTLIDIYNQHIDDKLDVTTIRHLTPRRLDKPQLTTASTTYAAMLKQRTTVKTMTDDGKQPYKKPPRAKPNKFGMTFEATDFPTLNKDPATVSATTSAKQTTETTKTTATSTNAEQPVYDYQAELDRITAEIENNLKAQFDSLFNQMESKIEKLTQQQAQNHEEQQKVNAQNAKQQAQNHEEQQKVNAQNAKQLAWVVDNMKRFLKCAVPTSSPFILSPSPFGDGQS